MSSKEGEFVIIVRRYGDRDGWWIAPEMALVVLAGNLDHPGSRLAAYSWQQPTAGNASASGARDHSGKALFEVGRDDQELLLDEAEDGGGDEAAGVVGGSLPVGPGIELSLAFGGLHGVADEGGGLVGADLGLAFGFVLGRARRIVSGAGTWRLQSGFGWTPGRASAPHVPQNVSLFGEYQYSAPLGLTYFAILPSCSRCLICEATWPM